MEEGREVKCPHGHRFGNDHDSTPDCDWCNSDTWSQCMTAWCAIVVPAPKGNNRTLSVQCLDCREVADLDVSTALPDEDALEQLLREDGWIDGRCEDCAAKHKATE